MKNGETKVKYVKEKNADSLVDQNELNIRVRAVISPLVAGSSPAWRP
jgi:hypothetical protein